MNSDGVPHDDMPNFLKPGRRDVVPLSDAAVEALLAGTELPPEAAPMLQPVADVLSVMRAGPASDELAGEAMALAEFRRAADTSLAGAPAARAAAAGAFGAGVSAAGAAAGGPDIGRRAHRRRRTTPGAWLSTRAAVTGAIAVLGLGGLATAAYAGVLPAPMQRLAHDVIGAPGPARPHPAAHTHLGRHRAADGSALGGSPAHRACTVYWNSKAHGTTAQRDVAYHNLIKAAGGAAHIGTYCGHGLAPSTTRSHAPHPGKKKKVPPGQVRPKKKVPPGQQRGKHKGHSKTRPNAHAHGHGQSGNNGHRHGNGAHRHKNPVRHRAVTSRSQ